MVDCGRILEDEKITQTLGASMGQLVCGNVVYGVGGTAGMVVGGAGVGVVGNLVTGLLTGAAMTGGQVQAGMVVMGPANWLVVSG